MIDVNRMQKELKSKIMFQRGYVNYNRQESKVRTLYVKKITFVQLLVNGWSAEVVTKPNCVYYVRCNKKGVVNFDTTLLYSDEELVERNNVKIIK